jgi:very-short-patch-repair endonuclease
MSDLEETFSFHLRAYNLEAEREYKFTTVKNWCFDFAFPDKKIAIEIEGGTWNGGRHIRGAGFEEDCIKYNQAVLEGWRLLRFTSRMVNSGEAIRMVLKILEVE